MTKEEELRFVNGAFEALVRRGVAKQTMFAPSTVTDEEIDAFEKQFDVKLPSLFRTFLSAYCYDFSVICAPILLDGPETAGKDCEKGLWWIELIALPEKNPLNNLYGLMESFREVCTNTDLVGLDLESIRRLVPIGEWDGTLCIDLSDGTLCSFDQTVFDWKKAGYLDEDKIAHGVKRMAGFKELLEVYFYGKYDAEYERQIAENKEEKPDYTAYIQR